MMTFPVNKNHLFKLLLAFYFLFFSISPFAYAVCDNKKTPEILFATAKTLPRLKNSQVSGSTSTAGAMTEKTPLAKAKTRVFVKKIRAITPEDPSQKISSFTNASIPENFSIPVAQTVSALNAAPESILQVNGFNPLYAGNSPPAV